MKFKSFFAFSFFLLALLPGSVFDIALSQIGSLNVMAQKSPVGLWKTIDDNTGEARSHIEIYEQNGKVYGKIVKLLQSDPDTVCDECTGSRKDQPIVGMVILESLEPYKDYWSYGTILDPENGKTYKCSLWVEGDDILKVRGYIGISALGRSQNWHKVK